MSSGSDLTHPRDELMATMERIYRYRMTTTSGGNLSILDGDGSVWITPARVDKGGLRRDDIVRVRPDGGNEGPHKPSSELPFHRAIYEARPDIRAIVHAHPVALVAFSICGEAPDTRLLHQARHVCGEVGLAPYALPGSEKLGRHIARAFASGFHCVVLDNHGVVVGGEDLQSAFQRFETLEFTAKTIVKARQLGRVRYLTEEQVTWPRRSARPMAPFVRQPAGSDERELRHQVCAFVRRGYEQRLLISTEGSFSARVSEDAFVITPYRMDRASLVAEDLVLVRGDAAEEGKIPSRASRNHRAIYARHPGVRAIVNAYTVNATAFSVSGARLDARTIPESYVFLREVARVPYGIQFGDPARFAAYVSPDRPVALLENDGMLVCGTSVLDAFDRLEVLETTAEALINARHLGPLSPMSDRAIADLKQAFLSHAPRRARSGRRRTGRTS
jgi:L-fuculose-phosphate aldolase